MRSLSVLLMIIFSLGLGCSDSNDSGSTSGSGGGDGFGGTEGVDAQLNTLFNLGNTDTTYTGLGDAGVLLHQWDGANRTDPEWIPSPGNSGHSVLAISSSITNAQLRTHDGFTGVYTVHTPYPPAGGLIYPTFPFESKEIQIGCMGAQDIGSDARWNAGCGCRDEPVCDAFFNTNVFPITPKNPVTSGPDVSVCQNSCGSNYMGNPDAFYWSKCDTASSEPLADFATGNCLAKPLPTEGSNWYISGAQFQGKPQLAALMAATKSECAGPGTGKCYNEIMVKTTSFYQQVPAEPQTSQPVVGQPKPGGILAFFYLSTAPGHYPPTNLAPGSDGQWATTDGDGQCSSYSLWKKFRNLYPDEETVFIEFDLSQEQSPFKTACTNPDSACDQKQIDAGCPSGDV